MIEQRQDAELSNKSGISWLAGPGLGLVIAWGGPALAETPPAVPGCLQAALNTERTERLPPGLLLAIALVESGRDGKPNAAVITRNGRSLWGEAARKLALRGRLQRGHFGCMQISVYWHGDAFPSQAAMLDPARNVGYAARYLTSLRQRAGNWRGALLRYHGAGAKAGAAYLCRVRAALTALGSPSADLLGRRPCAPAPEVDEQVVALFRASLRQRG